MRSATPSGIDRPSNGGLNVTTGSGGPSLIWPLSARWKRQSTSYGAVHAVIW